MLGNPPLQLDQTPPQFGQRKPSGPPRLLVIDDVQVHRMVIGRVGERAGFVASHAMDPASALALSVAQDFDCATLDLSLGERAGIELLAAFAQMKVRFPIIIISGSESEVADAAFELGRELDLNMLTPINKPVDLTRLRDLLVAIAAEWQIRNPPSSKDAST